MWKGCQAQIPIVLREVCYEKSPLKTRLPYLEHTWRGVPRTEMQGFRVTATSSESLAVFMEIRRIFQPSFGGWIPGRIRPWASSCGAESFGFAPIGQSR